MDGEKLRVRLYIDESGDHRNPAQEREPYQRRYLCLAGVALRCPDQMLTGGLVTLKQQHLHEADPDDVICMHREDIVNRRGAFAILRDDARRSRFDADLLEWIKSLQFFCIAVVIDKWKHRLRLRRQTDHPYHFGMHVLMERYVGRLAHLKNRGDVMAEVRGGREDRLLKDEYTRVYSRGTVSGHLKPRKSERPGLAA